MKTPLGRTAPSLFEPLEPRQFLSAAPSHAAAAASKQAAAAHAARVVPDQNITLSVDGKRFDQNDVLDFGTVAQGQDVAERVVTVESTLTSASPLPGLGKVSAPAGFTVTADRATDGRTATIRVTVNTTTPGTKRGDVVVPFQGSGTAVTFRVRTEVVPTPAVNPIRLDVALPANPVGGQRNTPKGKVRLQFANTGPVALTGKTALKLFASADPTLDAGDLPLGSLKTSLRVPAGGLAAVTFNYANPIPPATGDYYLIASAEGPTIIAGAATVALPTSASPIVTRIERPFVNFVGASTTAGPAFTTAHRAARVTIPVNNTGNVDAKGTRISVELFVSPTPTIDPNTLVPLASYQNLSIRAFADSQSFRTLTPPLPKSLPAGFTGSTYYVVARITAIQLPPKLNAANTTVLPSNYFLVR